MIHTPPKQKEQKKCFKNDYNYVYLENTFDKMSKYNHYKDDDYHGDVDWRGDTIGKWLVYLMLIGAILWFVGIFAFLCWMNSAMGLKPFIKLF